MTAMNIVIRSGDGDVVGYAYEEPFEIGCMERISERFVRILEQFKISMDAHTELTGVDAGTPIPPHTKPISKQTIVVDFCIELGDTTGFEFDDEPSESTEEIRAAVDGNVIFTEEHLTPADEYYEFLAQTTYAIAEDTTGDTERMVQRQLEKFLTRYSFEEAEERTRREFNATVGP